jgi:hypothetical protein
VCERRIAEALLGLVVVTTATAALPLVWQARRLSSGWIETAERAWSFYGKVRESRMMAMPGQNPWQSTAVRLTFGFALSRCLARAHIAHRLQASGVRTAPATRPTLESLDRRVLALVVVQRDCAATAPVRRSRQIGPARRALDPSGVWIAFRPPESPLAFGPPWVVA